MTDLRAYLADAIDNYLDENHPYDDSCVGGIDTGRVVDVLLSLPGTAIVDLPEPDSERYEGDEHEPVDRLSWRAGDYAAAVWDQCEVQISALNHGGWYTDEPITPTVSRAIAAALLAAANAAETQGLGD